VGVAGGTAGGSVELSVTVFRCHQFAPGNESSRERESQGAKGPGIESSRERIGQGPIGQFAPGSELAREEKGCESSAV